MKQDFHQLFIRELEDIHSAEKQIAEVMPEIIREAHNEHLKEALKEHYAKSKEQMKKLDEIAKELKIHFSNAKSPMLEGILKEWHAILKADYAKETRDAAIIALVQRVEHYEIAVYGVLKAFAKNLKLDKIEGLLKEFSHEEGHQDKKLTALAEGTWFREGINAKAHLKNDRKVA